MASVCQCDNCKKIIGDDDIKIKLNGYEVSQNRRKRMYPMGYGIGKPEEFCSFTCLAEWATKEQEVLNDFKELGKKYEEKRNQLKI